MSSLALATDWECFVCVLVPTLTLSTLLFQKKYRDFRLQGVLDSTLNSKMYDTVRNRLTLEEATASVREGGMSGISMKDSDEDDDDD